MKVIVRILANKEVITTLHKEVIATREEYGFIRIYGSDEGHNYVASYDRNDLLSYAVEDIPDDEVWARTLENLKRGIRGDD